MFALKPDWSVNVVILPRSKTHKFSTDTVRGLSADSGAKAGPTSLATGHNYSGTLTVRGWGLGGGVPVTLRAVTGLDICVLSVDFTDC